MSTHDPDDESYAARLARRFSRDSMAKGGLWLVVVAFIMAALAPFLANNHALVRVADGKLTFPVLRSLEPIEWRYLAFVPLAAGVAIYRSYLLRPPRRDLALALVLLWIAVIIVVVLPARLVIQHSTQHEIFRLSLPLRLIWALLFGGFFVSVITRSWREFFRIPQINITWVILIGLLFEAGISHHPTFNDPTNDRTRPASFKIMPLIPWSPTESSPDQLVGPSWKHLCGTDSTGRDVAARLLHGARISLSIGFVSQGISLACGVTLGALAGYYRRWVDIGICRFIEVMECFPSLLLILVIIGLSDSQNNMQVIMAVIGFTGWTGTARLVRGEFLRLGGQTFPQAAHALGAGDLRVILRHLLPNSLGPILVTATFGVASAILIESSLSFLGFGMQEPVASWGGLINEGQKYIDFAWWLAFFPGVVMLLTIMSYNFVGEGLRDAVDPRLRVK